MQALEFDRPSPAEHSRWATLPRMLISIERRWGGDAVRSDGARLELRPAAGELWVGIDAPYHDDPAPAAAPGSLAGLWEYEVVELFLLGNDEHYLELEFGPHGHYLALRLEGVRKIRQQGMPLAYAATVRGPRWFAETCVPFDWLPPGLSRFNAYTIDGQGARRRYWAYSSIAGSQPDFHRLDAFRPLEEIGVAADAALPQP